MEVAVLGLKWHIWMCIFNLEFVKINTFKIDTYDFGTFETASMNVQFWCKSDIFLNLALMSKCHFPPFNPW